MSRFAWRREDEGPVSAEHDHPHEDGHHRAEEEHLADTASGVIRASIFGVSDGLVSNLALVAGVAGGTSSSEAVILAGTAGLLAGAFSMAAGEYVSVKTQAEVMEKQLELERQHIERFPEEEQAHLARLLEESGIEAKAAADITEKIHQHAEPAVDFHALIELGIVPGQLGSAVGAAVASFLAFTVGAMIPLLPFLILTNTLWASALASAFALLLVGGAVTRITNRSVVVGAVRQLAFGLGAAGITYVVGRLVGTAVQL